MADILRVKRRTTGAVGAPAALANAELAYNEVDHVLYYGEGTGGTGGNASAIVAIAGQGLGATVAPQMNGAAAAGTAATWSRSDHIHPVDTSRAPLASPVFTGGPQAPTPATTDNDTSIATTAFVKAQGYATGGALPVPSSATPAMNGVGAAGSLATYARGDHVHPTDTSRAPIASPTFTGTPAAPTATAGTSTTQLATTAYVATSYAPLASPVFSGNPTAPTPIGTDNSQSLATTAFAVALRQDQQAPPTAPVSWNSQTLINLGDPSSPGDAANKRYVDANSAGLSAKGSVAVATTANITLSGLQTIDGYTTLATDRVLVKNQTTAASNGIYVAGAGTWARANDMDAWTEVPQAYVFVSNGTLNASSSWVCNSAAGGTLETTAIVWVQFSQAAQVMAGAGMIRTGNTIDVIGTAGRIAVLADSVNIDTGYVGQASITTLGTIATGTWAASTIPVARGGSGATTLTGFLKGNGTSAFTAQTQLAAATDISGLGSMAIQNAGAVAITGGSIDGIVFDCGTF